MSAPIALSEYRERYQPPYHQCTSSKKADVLRWLGNIPSVVGTVIHIPNWYVHQPDGPLNAFHAWRSSRRDIIIDRLPLNVWDQRAFLIIAVNEYTNWSD